MIRGALVALLLTAGAALAQEHPLFRWPVVGKVVKADDGRGLDILAPVGDAVHAAADGQAIYASDELASYGKMVVIRHGDGYATTYAFLSEIDVAAGARVKRGEVIGKTGVDAAKNRAELHFELRKGDKNLDPVGYLTAR